MVDVQPDTQIVEWIVPCVTFGFSAPGVQAGSGSGAYEVEQTASACAAGVVGPASRAVAATVPDRATSRVKRRDIAYDMGVALPACWRWCSPGKLLTGGEGHNSLISGFDYRPPTDNLPADWRSSGRRAASPGRPGLR